MAREPRGPRYRADRDVWVTQIGGKQIRLARGRGAGKAARIAFHKLLAAHSARETPSGQVTVAGLVAFVQAHHARHSAKETQAFYRSHLGGFAARYGERLAEEIRPLDVDAWVEENRQPPSQRERRANWRFRAWSESTAFGAVTAVKAAWSHAKEKGLISVNPLVDMRRPSMEERQVLLSPEQIRAIYDATPDQQYRDFLDAMHESGARPSEISKIEAGHCDFDARTITLPKTAHKTGRATGKPRIFPMSSRMESICRRLAERWPDGPIFRNLSGRPWTRQSLQRRVHRLREQLDLPLGGGIYSIRHSFTDDALEQGVPIKTVAELLGHSSTAMVDKHYSRLRQRTGHMQAALARFRPDESTSREPSEPTEPSDD